MELPHNDDQATQTPATPAPAAGSGYDQATQTLETPAPAAGSGYDQATQTLATPAPVAGSGYDQATQTPATPAPAAGSGYDQATQTLATPAPAAGSGYPPGYRFVPTDVELIRFYLLKKVNNEPIPIPDMRDTNIRLNNPMALAATLPKIGDREWYFFTPRDRKYPNGTRPNRGTDSGFWKATGADKKVIFEGNTIGLRKSLVFYWGGQQEGGVRSDWIMHEFRLDQPPRWKESPTDMRLDDWVLCRIYEKPHKVVKRNVKRKTPNSEEPVDHVDVTPDDIPVLEQEQPIYNNTSTSTSTSTSAEAEQYNYQQDQQYLEQLPTLHVNHNNTGFVFEDYWNGFLNYNIEVDDVWNGFLNYNIEVDDVLNGCTSSIYLNEGQWTSSTWNNNEASVQHQQQEQSSLCQQQQQSHQQQQQSCLCQHCQHQHQHQGY